jgi:predicted flap endonuclease-1-like 5' DNA nuclease
MWYLIEQLAPFLLLAGLAGGLAGWCWHCMRRAEAVDRLRLERDQLRAQASGLIGRNGVVTPLNARSREVEAELEALRFRADQSAQNAADYQRAFENLKDVTDARIQDLEAQIAGMQSAPREAVIDMTPLKTRIADLEAALNEARARSDDADALRARLSLLEAEAASPKGPSVEDRAQMWRSRWLEARVHHLEGEQAHALLQPGEDPRVPGLEQELNAARAQIVDLEAQLRARPDAEDELNRNRWRARYFEARTAYLEDEARKPIPAPEPVIVEKLIDPVVSAEEQETLNRNRWRMRYLEARQTYLNRQNEHALTLVRERDDKVAEYELLLEEAEKERDAALARVNDLDPRLAELAKAREEAVARLSELERELAEADAATRAAKDESAPMRTEIASLRQQIAAVHAERARIAEMEGALTLARSEHSRARARVAELEAELASLRAQPMADPEENARLRWRARYLDNRISFLEQSLAQATRAPTVAPGPRSEEFAPLQPAGAEVRPAGLPAARNGAPDDLRLIDGVGPRVESTLNSLGVYHFDQIAAWTPANVDWIERYLAFKGRVGRERWVEQAQALSRGDDAGEARRRYLEGENV